MSSLMVVSLVLLCWMCHAVVAGSLARSPPSSYRSTRNVLKSYTKRIPVGKAGTFLRWVIGGYYVSAALFNMADLVNQFACPLPPDTESVVSKIINPEDNDVMAMAVGSIAPCISAPWWEEVLYRGFLLPALALYLPLKAAVPTGSLLFAAHHMNLQAMFPLSVLGLIWSLLYIYSNNLLVTVIIHAMWNSRVFLGSLLGL